MRVFIPKPLPPDPPVVWTDELHQLLEKASGALGRLDGIAVTLPDTGLFLYSYVRKEALLSSQIEGTQSTLSELLLAEQLELPGIPKSDDGWEVVRYITAMEHGLRRLRQEDFPVSLRLIREVHEKLLKGGRGGDQVPGEFRTSQNWFGGDRPGKALFVPPPPEQVLEHMGALELFLHDKRIRMPTLVKAAFVHAQFETIHPFLDGNGRIGRLLVTLLLCADGVLREPLLYLSLYLKTHRERYYELLQQVRTQGAWEPWLAFFLAGVAETADQAIATARRLLELFRKDEQKFSAERSAGNILRVHQELRRRIVGSISSLAKATGLSDPTVTSALKKLEKLKMVSEVSGRRWGRNFCYDACLNILEEGTEPIPPR